MSELKLMEKITISVSLTGWKIFNNSALCTYVRNVRILMKQWWDAESLFIIEK